MRPLTTFLQINLQHLFFEAKDRGEKIDFEKVWKYFNSRENEYLIRASIYILRGDDFDSSKFESKLISIGYTIKAKKNDKILIRWRKPPYYKRHPNKPVIPYQNIYRDAGNEVEITVDCIDAINNFDKLILMSGEGDFTSLCQYLKKKNKQIELWCFEGGYNSIIESYVDKIHTIDETFFYKKPIIKVFGPSWGPK
jgi:uncharacterized LabA/DUF88 family protein